MTAYFITATGTGVGKTFTTCALLEANPHARAYKPVISGWSDDGQTDTAQIIAATSVKLSVDEVSPWRFTAPLSPHRAAALESKRIVLVQLVAWSGARIAQPCLTLIEGVGGVMVPLNEKETVLDWMVALNIPIILVVGSYLGTISHTLTAIEVIKARGLTIAALILNETAGSAVELAEAQIGLAEFVRDIPLRATQPLVSSPREATAIAALMKDLK